MQTLNTDTKVQSETPERIAAQIVAMYYPDDDELEGAILSALRNERERCAKVADERAAFNRRLMKTHPIGDPMADLKSTRADEAVAWSR